MAEAVVDPLEEIEIDDAHAAADRHGRTLPQDHVLKR